MADWWMGDTEILVSYHLAKDKIDQIQVIAELNAATIAEAVEKLVGVGGLSRAEADNAVKLLADRTLKMKISGTIEKRSKELYDEGYSDQAIGKFIGVSKGQVQYWRTKRGYPANVPAKSFDGKWW